MAIMSPMDSFKYFEAIRYTEITLSAIGTNKICSVEPRRVALMIMIGQGPFLGTLLLAPSPNITTAGGQVITQSNTPIILDESRYGPLVQSDWYMLSAGGANKIAIAEVLLNSWSVKQEAIDNGTTRTDAQSDVS